MGISGSKRLSTRVLWAILSVYFGVVLTQCTLQFFIEYGHVKNDIKEELAGLEDIYAEPLTTALWASTIPQVEALANTITKLPIVTGIEIINKDSGLQVTRLHTRKSDLFHRFQLFYTFEKNSVYLATVTAYSDSSVVLDRLKVGFLLLITQIMVLSVVLTMLYIWAIRKFLKIPLLQFVDKIENATAEKEEGGHFDFNFTTSYAEFEPLVNVLQEMGKKIAKQFHSITKINEDLESVNISLETKITERKQTLEDLRISEQKYRALVDNSLVGVFTSTLDGRFIFVNDAMARMSDFDTPELMMAQGPYSHWSDPKQRARMLAILQKHGSVTNYEAKIITNTGRHLHALFSAELLGDTISGMLMDVTDIHQAREALQISQTSLVEAQEVAHIGSWNLDLLENNLIWTDENYRIFGIPKGTPMTYEKFLEVVHPEDREYVDKQWSAAIEGEPYDIEHRILIDNEVKWVREKAELRFDDKGNPINGFGITQDISEHKLAQLEIQKSFTDIKRLKKLLEEESSYLREEINLEHNYKNIIGTSDAIKYVLFKVEQVSESDTNVLVLGETGTGKELIARAIHHNSPRQNRPLIKVNCTTLPSHLIESELFGHERGSFTNAHTRHMGRFEVADGSSIFLDEIGELPLELQAKMLRVLEDGEFERLGSSKTMKVNVRIIAATNRDLEKDVSEGRFRQDLWYRLNVFPITVPPLRERVEDIPLIVQYYLDLFNKKQGKHITSVPVKIMKAMQSYPWLGNVRELVNIIERAVVNTSGSKLRLAEELKQNHQTFPENFKSLDDMERDYIIKVLEKAYWKISGKNSAAEILGLNRGTLRAKMKKMDIHKP